MFYAKKTVESHVWKIYVLLTLKHNLDENKKHVVNYAVLQDFYGNEWTFKNIEHFCVHLFKKKNKDYTFIAHYAKGYDVQFILNWLVGRGLKPNIISVGNKVLSLKVKFDYNIRFIDSLSFTLESRWLCGNTLASDANAPSSTPGGTLELDTGYHPFVGRWNV